MTSLEDQILKKNVPGRYSTWKQDQDDKLSEAEGKKLGPLTLQQDKKDNEDVDSNNDTEHEEKGNVDGVGEDSIYDDYGDDDDDEFMQNYRQQRLQELKQQATQQQQQQQQEGSKQLQHPETYETIPDNVIVAVVPEIDGIEYVNLVNEQQCDDSFGENNEESLLILLFHDLSDPATRKVLRLLAHLCIRCALHQHQQQQQNGGSSNNNNNNYNPQRMRCKRLDVAKTGKHIDPIVLPALLIHQNGTLKHNLTPILQHLPGANYTPSDLHELLESCNVSLHGLTTTDHDGHVPEKEVGDEDDAKDN